MREEPKSTYVLGRRRRRRSPWRRIKRWTRAFSPFAFVGLAGLLSAGVITVVEQSPPQHGGPAEDLSWREGDEAAEEIWDDQLFFEPGTVEAQLKRERGGIQMDAPGALDLDLLPIMRESVLGPEEEEMLDPSEEPSAPEVDDAELREDTPPVSLGPPAAPVPEPGSALLVASGALLLRWRTLRSRSA